MTKCQSLDTRCIFSNPIPDSLHYRSDCAFGLKLVKQMLNVEESPARSPNHLPQTELQLLLPGG